MKKIIIFLLILFLGSLVYAAEYQVDEDMNMLENNVYNGTYANFTYIYMDGILVLTSSAGDITGINTDGDYLEGGCASGTCNLTVNMTNMNDTIDLRDSDTTYDNSTGISLVSTTFSIVLSYFQGLFVELSDTAGGDISGNFSNLVVADDSHTHDWANITNKFITAVDDIYIYMSGTTATLNETYLNATIDDRDADTTYTAEEDYLYLDSTTFKMNTTVLNSTIDLRDSDTTYSDLSEFNDNLGNRGYTHLTNFSDDLNHVEDNESWNETYADTLYRAEDWNNFTGIPTATPSDGDTTHLSTADQIRDYIIGLGYSTTTGTVTSVATDDTYLTGGAITTTGIITFNTTLAGTSLAVNSSDYWDGLGSPSDINAADITDDGTYRLESWDNFTGIPTATPSNGDVTHLSTANHIYDWVVGSFMQDSDINTFTELQSWVSDKTLVNEEDIATIDANWVNTANPWDISTETNLGVGNGITITDDTLTVVGGTALTADAGGLSVTGDAIGDTQLAFNTGQHLTSTSDPTFNNVTVETVKFEVDTANHRIYDNATCILIVAGTTTLEICE